MYSTNVIEKNDGSDTMRRRRPRTVSQPRNTDTRTSTAVTSKDLNHFDDTENDHFVSLLASIENVWGCRSICRRRQRSCRWWLWPYIKPYFYPNSIREGVLITSTWLTIIVLQFTYKFTPVLQGQLLDKAANGANTSEVAFLAIGFGITMFLETLLSELDYALFMKLQHSAMKRLNEYAMTRFLSAKFDWLKNRPPTQLADLVQEGTNASKTFVRRAFADMLPAIAGIFITVGLCIELYDDARIALVLSVSIIVWMLISYFTAQIKMKFEAKTLSQSSSGKALATDAFEGIEDVKLAAAEDLVASRHAHALVEMWNTRSSKWFISQASNSIQRAILVCCVAYALYIKSLDVAAGLISVGKCLAIVQHVRQAFGPVQRMRERFAQVTEAYAILQHLDSMLIEAGSVATSTSELQRTQQFAAVKHDSKQNVICRLRNVNVTVPAGASEKSLLKTINVELSRGSFTMVVGRSGSGKSTLLRTLLGLQSSTTGTVEWLVDGNFMNIQRTASQNNDVDGISPDQLATAHLRARAAVIPAKSHIFLDSSVLYNVALSYYSLHVHNNPTMQSLSRKHSEIMESPEQQSVVQVAEKALQAACILDRVNELPDSLFTRLRQNRKIRRRQRIAAEVSQTATPSGTETNAKNLSTNGSATPIQSPTNGGISLSSGEEQRLGIARAFFKVYAGHGPSMSHKETKNDTLLTNAVVDVLVADEPTAHLDPPTSFAVLATLQQLAHDRGMTVVIATHDVEIAARYADRMIVMREGSVALDGDASSVLQKAHELRLPLDDGTTSRAN